MGLRQAPEEIGNISHVEMELRAIGDGTELTFTHANLTAASTPSAPKPSHEQDWSAALDKLARCLVGVDIPWLAPSAESERYLRQVSGARQMSMPAVSAKATLSCFATRRSVQPRGSD